MPLATTPLNEENAPPTSSLAGAPPAPGTMATASTEPSDPSPGSNVRSTEPSALNRATCRRVSPPAVVKSPTTTTRPSGCNASAVTEPFTPWPGSNVTSGSPVASNRATPLRARPLIAANPPATRILPSGWSARAATELSAPSSGSKVRSKKPLASSRASRLRTTPFTAVKSPAITVVPKFGPPATRFTATARTVLFAPGVGLKAVIGL